MTCVQRYISCVLLATVCLTGVARAQESILERLSHDHWLRRIEAMREARKRQSTKLLEKLIELAQNETHQGARRVAIESLGYYKGEKVGQFLVKLDGPKTPDIFRASALEAMARRRDAGTYERLVAGLSGGFRQRAAVRGFLLMPDPRAYKPLAKLFRSNRFDILIRNDLMRALIHLNRSKGIALMFSSLSLPGFRHAWAVVKILREFPGDDVRKRSLALLKEDDTKLQINAIRILGKAGDAKTISHLTKLLIDDTKLRLSCVTALGEIGGARAMRNLIPYLEDDSPKLRAAVANSIGVIGMSSAGEALIVALRKERELEPTLQVLAALGKVREQRAVRDLVGMLDDKRVLQQPRDISSIWTFPYNIETRAVAVWALRNILDGKPPLDLQQQGRGFKRVLFAKTEFVRIAAWWRKHGHEARYSFTGKRVP